MSWSEFPYFALSAIVCWIGGACFAIRNKGKHAVISTLAGIVIFLFFIMEMWISLERPPLRTMGETRLWYSFFLPLAGLIVYVRWQYKWILSFSTLLSAVFIFVNILKPEIHDKTLMPALQSPWFAPHVIVYMFCYALLGAATLMAVWMLWKDRQNVKSTSNINLNKELALTDDLVHVGLSFMTIGMLFGALWAKEVWGHYWGWDPKETWAAATWFFYLTYIHLRISRPHSIRLTCWLLILSFVCLQMCWWGINYLPTTSANSVHTYSMQ